MTAPPVSFADHPYAAFLHEVERPARYVGGEFGQTRKPWDAATTRVCLAFPDAYDVGMSHIGTRILYAILNGEPDVLCERAFAPWADMEAKLRERGLPVLSLENARSLRDFDVVGISLQHELIYSNCLTLLDLCGIPLRAEDRTDADPLVLGGGSAAAHPEPMAPFFDAFVIGDGERKALEVARLWARDRRAGVPRRERLANLARLGSVYVPSLMVTASDQATGRTVVQGPACEGIPFPIQRATVSDLDEFPFPEMFPTGGPEAVFERLSVEIARGCVQGCRFCQGGMIFRPERERRAPGVVRTIRRAVAASGQDEVSLTSLSTADYSHLSELVRDLGPGLADQNVALGVSSLRAYGLQPEVLDALRLVRSTSLTFAPEGGTQRMRDVINKNVTEEQILDTVERVMSRGFERIKLYFMIGLPTETEADVRGILDTGAKVRSAGKRSRAKVGRPAQVAVSVSTFVPKPHTPFQWCQMINAEVIGQKQSMLRDGSKAMRLELKMHEWRGSVLEGVLSRGDRRLADVIEKAWRAGARFDAWDGNVRWDAWQAAMEACGLKWEEYLAALPFGGRLPWDHIDVGLDAAFLRREYERAQREVTSPPCGRPVRSQAGGNDNLVCYQCGAGCDLKALAQRRSEKVLPAGTPAPPKVTEGDSGLWVRIHFQKTGRAMLLGHLDIVRELGRLLRRARMPVRYTEGFHPKPQMTFGPALALGVPSLDEYVDVRMVGDPDGERGLQRLRDTCPEGMHILGMRELRAKEPAIGAVAQRAEYLIGLPAQWTAEHGGESAMATRVEGMLGAAELWIMRETKTGSQRIDVRPGLNALWLAGSAEREVLRASGVAGEFVVVGMDVSLTGKGPKPREVAGLLVGEAAPEARFVRVKLKGAGGEDLVAGQG